MFVSNPSPATNVSLSKIAVLVSLDSNTATSLIASATFNDISSSSTRNPYARLDDNPLNGVATP